MERARLEGKCALRGLALFLLLAGLAPEGIRPAERKDVAESVSPADPELDPLLERIGRVASLFLDTTLRFTCGETVTYSAVGTGTKKVRFNYFYVREADGELRNFRTWHGQPREGSVPREVRPSEFHVPTYVENAYFWVFVFHPSRWQFHRYRILGEDRVLDRPALRVQFEGIPPFKAKVNDWCGIAWIDREDAQLLKVEAWRPEQYALKKRFATDVAEASGKPRNYSETYVVEQISTELTVVKNGMRFPGSVVTRDLQYRVVGGERSGQHRERLLLRVEQIYQDYLFFGVRTEEEIKGTLGGRREPGSP